MIRRKEKELSVCTILTFQCNLRCDYCYEHDQTNLSTNNIKMLEKVLQGIKKKIKGTDIEFIDFTFRGGELFLIDNLDEYFQLFLDIFQDLGIKIEFSINTNMIGKMDTYLKVQKVVSTFPEHITLSFGASFHESISPQKSYDLLTKMKSMFEVQAINLKDAFTEEKVKSIRDIFPVNNDNLDNYDNYLSRTDYMEDFEKDIIITKEHDIITGDKRVNFANFIIKEKF